MQGGIPTLIPPQILLLKHIFGLNTSVPRSISFLSLDRLFYLAGYYAVVFNPKEKEKSQVYFGGAEGCAAITAVALNPSKKAVVLGFKATEKPCLFYYELTASAKRKKIEYNDQFSFKSWVSVAFSAKPESKHMASLTNRNPNGDSMLVFWNPEKGRCEAQVKLTDRSEKDLLEILFNPNSESEFVSVLGEHSLRVFELRENSEQKSYSVEQLERFDNDLSRWTFKSHHYLSQSQHMLLLAEECSLICDYKGNVFQAIQDVGRCCANWAEGFILADQSIKVFRYQDQKYKLKFVNDKFNDKDTRIQSISVSEDKVLISLSNGSMMHGKIKVESNKSSIKLQFEPINLHFHSGAIVGMDVCVRKPLIATACKDKTIKIWNYEQRTVQTPKSEAETASCLSFHPSGLHLAVLYSDKIRILNLQKDGESVSTYKDINSFRNGTCLKFSHGGQYFAAASGNIVHLYHFYSNETVGTFSGHSAKIKSMAWSKEDNVLITCGADGIIMAYRAGNENCGSKLLSIHSSKEPRIKGLNFFCVTMGYDNTIFAMEIVGLNGQRVLKEVRLDGTQNKRELAHNNCSQLVFPSTGRVLFGGSDDRETSGSIKCYKYPAIQNMEEFQAHDNQGIERLCVTADDKFLVSAGRDGCLMIFDIRDKEARSDKLREVLPSCNEILITKSDLDSLKSDIENLKQQRNELESLNGMGPMKDDQVKQLKEKFSSDEAQFQEKYNAIIERKNLLRKKFDEEIRTKREQFENGLQQYDSTQAKNVMQESAKYDEVKRAQEMESIKARKQIERINKENQQQLRKMDEDNQETLKNKTVEKENILKKIQRLDREHDETMRQIKEEKLEEIKKIQNENAQQVQNIQEATLRAKSDVSITKKKIQEKQQDIENKRDQTNENTAKVADLKKANAAIEKEIEQQANIIAERDKTIDANERKIYELKKKAQQLEKFKYVLDHKIKELKKDISPRENEIATMKVETNRMDKNLKNLNSLNTSLAEFVNTLFKEEEALKQKIAGQRGRISYQNNRIKAFKDAMFATAQLIQQPDELRESVTELKEQFVSESMTQVKMDSEIEQEYENQKQYLKNSIKMLKRNLQKDSDMHKHENIKIMKENVDLIKEISSLRIQIKEQNKEKRSEDENKNKGKNEPTEQQIRLAIAKQQTHVETMKKQISDLQERLMDG